MAHREFRGTDGREWAVWTVQPEYVERRRTEGSAPPAVSANGAVGSKPVERRGHKEYRVPIAGKFSQGWLCFETKGEKRRLAPYPPTWVQLSDEELATLCDTATRVEHGTRRLVE